MAGWSRAKPAVLAILALFALQGIVVLVYRSIEHRRRNAQVELYAERLSGQTDGGLAFVGADGTSRTLGELRGTPVLLHFWATWCPPCRDELPGLLDFGRSLVREDRAKLVAVTVDSDWGAVGDFFGGEIPPEVRMDPGPAAEAFGVWALPETFVVGADGELVLRLQGARDWSDQAVRRALSKELASTETSR